MIQRGDLRHCYVLPIFISPNCQVRENGNRGGLKRNRFITIPLPTEASMQRPTGIQQHIERREMAADTDSRARYLVMGWNTAIEPYCKACFPY